MTILAIASRGTAGTSDAMTIDATDAMTRAAVAAT